jgi:hypothetical protein
MIVTVYITYISIFDNKHHKRIYVLRSQCKNFHLPEVFSTWFTHATSLNYSYHCFLSFENPFSLCRIPPEYDSICHITMEVRIIYTFQHFNWDHWFNIPNHINSGTQFFIISSMCLFQVKSHCMFKPRNFVCIVLGIILTILSISFTIEFLPWH